MSIPAAADTLQATPHYRADCFRAGLARLGFKTGFQPQPRPGPDDVLLVWNRGGMNDVYAQRYLAAGARVLVAENGYIGTDPEGRQLYALALDHHLGAGRWVEGEDDRWSGLGIEPRAWRERGDEIVVLPQRGIGEPGIAMPKDWTVSVVRRLRAITDRPVRVRQHPGKDRTHPGADLERAWAAVTWASGAGVKAIVHGVPVFFEMPSWIGRPAALFGLSSLETPFVGDRLPMLRRLAWAQWELRELESGEAFKRLLG